MLWKGSVGYQTAHSKPRVARLMFGIAVFVSVVFGGWLTVPSAVIAQTPQSAQTVGTVARQAGVRNTDLFTLIGRVIYIALSLVGLIILGYLLYAGFLYMTAGEDADKVASARRMIQNAIIGLVIIAASFAITAFVLSRLSDVSTGTSSQSGSSSQGGLSFPSAAGALGNGIIEYHVPARDATGVPRNTSIIVTFKEPMRLSSLIQGYDDRGTPADLTDDRVATALNIGTVHIIKRD